MLYKDMVRKKSANSHSTWQPTREEFQRMAIKHDTLLKYAKEHADDPTGILSCLYHDIIEKYCNVRQELRALRQLNAEYRRTIMILKMALERKGKQPKKDHGEEAEKW
jgi:hypothetical protein